MSAILHQSKCEKRLFVKALPLLELEPESIFADEPRSRTNPAAELERLRPLLVDYDPHSEPVQYYQPPRDYGSMIAKFILYSLLGIITLGVGLMIIAPFRALGGC
jgi:hypothetical protein